MVFALPFVLLLSSRLHRLCGLLYVQYELSIGRYFDNLCVWLSWFRFIGSACGPANKLILVIWLVFVYQNESHVCFCVCACVCVCAFVFCYSCCVCVTIINVRSMNSFCYYFVLLMCPSVVCVTVVENLLKQIIPWECGWFIFLVYFNSPFRYNVRVSMKNWMVVVVQGLSFHNKLLTENHKLKNRNKLTMKWKKRKKVKQHQKINTVK